MSARVPALFDDNDIRHVASMFQEYLSALFNEHATCSLVPSDWYLRMNASWAGEVQYQLVLCALPRLSLC